MVLCRLLEKKGKRSMAYASAAFNCSLVFLKRIFCCKGFMVANSRAVAAMSTANGIDP